MQPGYLGIATRDPWLSVNRLAPTRGFFINCIQSLATSCLANTYYRFDFISWQSTIENNTFPLGNLII